MKYFKKIIIATSLIFTMLGISSNANAVLITQDLMEGSDVIGTISINTDDADIFGGFGEAYAAVSFNFLGFDIPGEDVLFFQAIFNPDNLYAGIEFLNFDVDFALVGWAIDGYYDAFDNPDFNYFSVFDAQGLFYAGNLSLGQASVVSEPTSIALFSMMLVLVGLRLKKRA